MDIKTFFKFISKLEEHDEDLNISLSARLPSLELSTSFNFKVLSVEFFTENLIEDFFSNENLTFYIESRTISSKTEFLEVILEDTDHKYDASIILNQKLLNEVEKPVLHFYNDQSINDFFKLLSTKYRLGHLEKLKHKIDLRCETTMINNFSSTLMTLNSDNKEGINETTKNFFSLFHNKDVSALVIPGSVPSSDMINIEQKHILLGQLEQLANNKSGSSYRFIGKNTLTFSSSQMPDEENQKSMVKQLEATLSYLFEASKSVDQKLTFYRKILIDKLSKDTTFFIKDLDQDFFENSLHEANVIFDAFQDGEVSVFIKEKKEIIKEYMSISKEILSSIDQLKSNLQRNIITLMVLFISNFALKSKGITQIEDFRMILLVAIAFLIIIIILHFLNDRSILKNITNKRAVFNEHFKFLSSKSKSVKSAIETTITDESKTLKRLLDFSITLFLIFLSILFYLLSKSYSHEQILFIYDVFKNFFNKIV